VTVGKEEEIAGVEANPAGLLPEDPRYYTYMGSLTAPPCSEGVTWSVLKTPVAISAEEISAFRQALSVRCPTSSAAQRARCEGESVTRKPSVTPSPH
jgi:carbonic anhydrase